MGGGGAQQYLGQNPQGQSQGLLGSLMGLGNNATPGGDVLGPLGKQFDMRLNDSLAELNSQGGRFSTGNLFGNMGLRERSLTDYNALASQILEHGRDRQLSAIMGLLGPVLGPTFGGPFTQGSSPWENILGGVSSIAGLGGLFGGGHSNVPAAPGGFGNGWTNAVPQPNVTPPMPGTF